LHRQGWLSERWPGERWRGQRRGGPKRRARWPQLSRGRLNWPRGANFHRPFPARVRRRKRFPRLQCSISLAVNLQEFRLIVIELPSTALVELDQIFKPSFGEHPPAHDDTSTRVSSSKLGHQKFRCQVIKLSQH